MSPMVFIENLGRALPTGSERGGDPMQIWPLSMVNARYSTQGSKVSGPGLYVVIT